MNTLTEDNVRLFMLYFTWKIYVLILFIQEHSLITENCINKPQLILDFRYDPVTKN